MSIWVTRSSPDNLSTARRLHADGARPLMVPVLGTVARDAPPFAAAPDAIVFSSRHAVRHHVPPADHGRIPAYAAGEAVATAARAAGYRTVTWSGGDDRSLCDFVRHLVPDGGTIAYVCSDRTSRFVEDRLAGFGFVVDRRVVYETRVIDAGEAQVALDQVSGILIHSAPAAVRVREVVEGSGWRGTIWCISAASAAVLAGLDGVRVAVARQPTEASLIGLVRRETGATSPKPTPPVRDDVANDN